MINALDKEILKVLVYFDGLGYPLTLWEIKKWLGNRASILEIRRVLSSKFLSARIADKFGLYFLHGRNELVETRRRRYRLSGYKFKMAKKIAKVFSGLPWILGVAVYSSLSFYNSRANSDIDLFLVVKKGRVWSARFFINLFLKLFNLRPTIKTSQDKICVSFLIDESGLDLSPVVFGHQRRRYIFGTGQFIFLYDAGTVANRFFVANHWLTNKLPNWFPYLANHLLKIGPAIVTVKWLMELLAGFIPEAVYKTFQLLIMPAKLKAVRNVAPSVIIGDKMIKLHDNEVGRRDDESFYNKLKKCLN